MKIEFCGQSSRDGDNWQANTSRLVNLYREIAAGKTQYTLKSVLGSTGFSQISGLFVRTIGVVGDYLYAVCGGRLQQIDAAGAIVDLGAMDDGTSATISGNNGDVTVCVGDKYYLWDGATLTEPAPGVFSAFGSLDYIGGYTVLSEKNGKRFQWSSQLDATTLPGLSFSSADGVDDDILRVAEINGVLYIFKETSHEVWYLTGGAGANAFERQAGGVVGIGLKDFGLLAKISTGGAFFVGNDGRAHIIGIGPVSTPAVETAIEKCRPEYCLTYEDEGHTFCAIIFRDCPAWVFDISMGEWHERAQGANLDPWKASVSAKFMGKWFIGRAGGDILKLGRVASDGGLPLLGVATSNTLDGDGQRITINEFEIFANTGFEAGAVELRLSKDSGRTWGAPRLRFWSVGEYSRRIIWRALGQSRQWTAELRMTDMADTPINSTVRIAA